MGKARINNLKFFIRNDVLVEEKRLGQQVEIDLEIWLSLTEAGRADDATQAVNYAEVNELIVQRVSNHLYDLIEGLASATLDDISANYQRQLNKIIIKIGKYSVPTPGFFDGIGIEMEREVQTIGYVALGSNASDPYANLVKARNHLSEGPQIQVVASSKLYKTDSYGYTDQDGFLNAVLKIDISYIVEELLTVTQGIEQAVKREKLIHWGPRIIGIGISLLGGQSVTLPHLQAPHQESTKRSFVLIPLDGVYAEEQLLDVSIVTWTQRSGNQEEVRVNEEEW